MSGESSDKDGLFLKYLGTGTDVLTNCEDWRSTHKVGSLVHCREVQHPGANSNFETRSCGPETWSKYDDRTEGKSWHLAGKAKGGASAAGVPISAKLKAAFSRSRSLYAAQYENKVVVETKAFKDRIPIFPTLLEKEIYTYVIEWLERYRDVRVEASEDPNNPVKRFEKYASKLKEGEWNNVADAITSYINGRKITHYVESITLGAERTIKKDEKHSTIEGDLGGGVEGATLAGVGGKAGGKSEKGKKTKQTAQLGRIAPDGGPGDDLGIVHVGILPISELVKNPSVKTILDEAIEHYHEEKQRKQGQQDRYSGKCIACTINSYNYIHDM